MPYLYTLLSLAFFFLIGHFVFFICKIQKPANPYLNVFAKLFTGLVVFIVFYSIYKTRGRTINLGFFIVAAAVLYLLRKNNLCSRSGYDSKGLFKFNFKDDLRILAEIVLITLGWCAFQAFGFQKTNFYFTDGDTINYCKIAEYLN
ncbi:MAG TPA: hypothetical protein VK808_12115, partial [Bacteroidia bacterium]|nr:hypothetical protein [Bacteroidia bacterium]